MDYLGGDTEGYNDSVIMIHPLLRDSTKEMIHDISNKLGYEGVLDLTHVNQDLSQDIQHLSTWKKAAWMKMGGSFKKKIDNYQQTVKRISRIIKQEVGAVEGLFYRMMYKHVDALFLRALNSAKYRYGIEDGIGDFLPEHWKYKTLNKHEILHTLSSSYHSYRSLLFSLISTRKLKASKLLYLKPRIPWVESFTNIDFVGNKCVGEYFLDNIRKLFIEKSTHKERKAIIFGSLVPDPRFAMDISREVEIYNSVIARIKSDHMVNSSQIWYKPHPRLDYDSWSYKKERLNCQVYDYDERNIGEVELCNKHLKAVYSVGSTSLLYAKALFDKESYLIDIRKEPVHPSAYEKYFTITRGFGIESIKLD